MSHEGDLDPAMKQYVEARIGFEEEKDSEKKKIKFAVLVRYATILAALGLVVYPLS